MTAAELASKLEARRNGSGWMARCPAHEDGKSSLSIGEGEGRRVLLKCFAGCSFEAILAGLRLSAKDLAPERPERRHASANGEKRIVATYDYRTADGDVLFQSVRYSPKDFRQRRPDGEGGWLWNLQGIEPVLFRLPEVRAAVAAGKPIVVCEGEKDILAVVERGLEGTCNAGGAGKWRSRYASALAGADAFVVADRDGPGRKHAQEVAASLHGKANSVRVAELPDVAGKPVKDAADYFAAGGSVADFMAILEDSPLWTPEAEPSTKEGATVSALRADPRPAIQLPGDERLLSDFAADLGRHLTKANIFTRGGFVVTVNDTGDGLRTVEPAELRTWVEKHLVCFKSFRPTNGQVLEIRRTMTEGDAGGVIASPQFHEKLRPVERCNPVPMPVLREGGALELLAPGYDERTRTFTALSTVKPADMPLEAARDLLRELLSEFGFADNQRSRAVAVAGMLTVFASSLVARGSLRPCFIFLANAEGAGKSMLVKVATVPVLGLAPVGCRPRDDEEFRKVLVASVLQARPVVFLDNVRGHLASEVLEAFLSAETFGGRVLGVSRNFEGPNESTVFVTGNACTVSPDMRRRSLFVELFLEAERAEDRIFRHELSVPVLLERRAEILGALWSLVRAWHSAGSPPPARTHASFPQWARTIGGIVEHAGFGCPLETPKIEAAADTEGEDMRELVAALLGGAGYVRVKFEDVVEAARTGGLLSHIIPEAGDMDTKAKSRLGRLLQRFDRRLVGGCRFRLEGKGHSRRFHIEQAQP